MAFPCRAAAAARALDLLEERANRFVVHFDVDVIDFTDAPLSENPGRNEGLAYDDAVRTLEVVLRSPKLAGLTLTELNPDHGEEDGSTLDRFLGAVPDAAVQVVPLSDG